MHWIKAIVNSTLNCVLKSQLKPTINGVNWNAALITQIRTFKDKDVLRLRCRDCRFVKIDDRWWVKCKTHPRHAQREHIEDIRRKWIVTHVTRGGKAFQKKPEAYICNLCPPGFFDYKKRMSKV
ncbi:39S ribosomal protein L36-like protein [Dinothrombium tinctorium]|uniref:Large ribosomal subunit protein bL36m n=1 Tax=Dinothrombium tinctorium TaxID=1965070 RepID=A0A3S3RLF6_9ACAR|nr:39S ribosomal protein L36-like protein [Dinothrombium tinctorium]RWS05333.1 39S ribosomal protein L36-like protein [Dinothrombium tinctorium]RWS05343.1 39S ribosomal protein L36-like protein [Dinothrombium tinctorium]